MRQNASLLLSFRNEGAAGAVFHVYDRTHLERIPRRYTVEAGRSLTDRWEIAGRIPTICGCWDQMALCANLLESRMPRRLMWRWSILPRIAR